MLAPSHVLRIGVFDRMAHPQVWQYVYEYETQRREARRNHQQPPCVVVILRGPPGTGKSTFALLLSLFAGSRGLETAICSADHFF
jgi:pantothenate kinase-related protein Tda10